MYVPVYVKNLQDKCSPDMLKTGKDSELDPESPDIKLRIRIHSEMFQIRNTAIK
jgi:hypothetical protein